MSTAPPALPLVVLGPTASGKSDVAMAFATSGSSGSFVTAASPTVEIVAVDSMQVYRGMDIGTAKPTGADRAAVVHHGLDLVDVDVDFTVADYAIAASDALRSISNRGHRAVLVAGTGLYLRSLTDPMEIPGRWPEVRSDLEAREATDGSAELHRQLATLDPLAASRMEPTNARRVVRALEVVLGGGRPFSSYGAGIAVHPPIPFEQVGLQWERTALAARIEARVRSMMTHGLLDEVRGLAARPGGWSRTARQALGYKELLAHLDGTVGLDEAVTMIVARTRRFAVRQERWFRRDPRVRWVPIHDDPVAEVVPILQQT